MLIIVKTNLHKSQRTAIHIGKSHNADSTSQNLPISMSLPTHEKNETCSKFERKNDINERMPAPNNGYKQCGRK